MAHADFDVHIANPSPSAKPRRKNKMAKQRRKKLSPAQIRAGFGGKRRKLAARTKHRKRSKPNPARRRSTKRATARYVKRSAPRTKKRAARKKHSHRRRNPMEIISWGVGNPAPRRKSRKKGSSMKRRRTTKRAVARTGRHSHKQMHRRRRRSNPGNLGSMKDWVVGGAGVLAGVVVTRAVPQMVLGANNNGPTGYLANVVTAVGAGWLSHMLFPSNRILTATVIAGGFATVISRIIADKTPFGSQLSLSGLGDWGLGLYQKSNFPYPPRLQNGRGPGSSMFTWGDGSQGLPAASFASAGSDSTGAC